MTDNTSNPQPRKRENFGERAKNDVFAVFFDEFDTGSRALNKVYEGLIEHTPGIAAFARGSDLRRFIYLHNRSGRTVRTTDKYRVRSITKTFDSRFGIELEIAVAGCIQLARFNPFNDEAVSNLTKRRSHYHRYSGLQNTCEQVDKLRTTVASENRFRFHSKPSSQRRLQM